MPTETPSLSEAPVRWGILSTAGIGIRKVIPGMQGSDKLRVTAIASRDLAKAKEAAKQLGIPKAYGSYEELLADPDIDAVYNPLPNHLHVPWSMRAAEAGKHVLCEKPLSLSVAEARQLIAVRDRMGVVVGEAFMVRTHPQWLETRRIIRSGEIGEVRAITGHFSYYMRDPGNIRSRVEWGGGALMDIGCYPINLARFLFGQEPRRVVGLIDRDPEMGIDRLTSAMLDFPAGQATFTCGTEHVPFQTMQIFGTKARIEVEIPFNAPPDRPCRIRIDDGSDLSGMGGRALDFPVVDQYLVQGESFSEAVRHRTPAPVPLEDSLLNMACIEAVFRSAESGSWEVPSIDP